MVTSILNRIACLGLPAKSHCDTTPIRTLNVLSLLILLVLLGQIPFIVVFWLHSGSAVLVLNIAHILLILAVLWRSYQGEVIRARAYLMTTFISFVCTSCILWPPALRFHYFLIVALFVSPCLFYPWERRHIAINMTMYAISFIAIDIWLIGQNTPAAMQPLTLYGDVFLLSAAIVSSVLINTQSQLQQRFVNQQKNTLEVIISRLVPKPILDLLVNNTMTGDKTLHFEKRATVLFADIEGYTQLSKTMPVSRLVPLLDDLYCRFDRMAESMALDKIKTNGDQYMVVAGVLEDTPDFTLRCAHFAIAVQQIFALFCEKQNLQLRLRVGMATGDVYAGIIGTTNVAFDVWGDTVNLASRLESQGAASKIQICASTAQRVKENFVCQPREEINLKGIGKLKPLWLIREKTCIT